MTITYYYFTSDYERCSKLAFGIPLEDCFPADDIHPSLKELFLKAYENIVLCGYPIDVIISKLQGSIEERLSIKESAVLCKPMSGVVSPGALLWVIRHFVGLIPVPLLSRYTNSETFNWIRLSQFCNQALLRRSPIGRGDKLLVSKIAEELLRLPAPNLLLFGVLINFIRALTINRNEQYISKVNKSAVICLLKYFCSSIFVRPYRPGYNKEVDRLYMPFLLFVVLKWPGIERVFKENVAVSSRDFNKCSHNYTRCNSSGINLITHYSSNSSKSAYTQTDPYESDCELSTISEESIENEPEFLKDVSCQTEFSIFGKKKQQKYRRCCCESGSNFETNTNLSSDSHNLLSEDKDVQTEFCDDFAEIGASSSSCVSPQSSDGTEVISISTTTPHYGCIDPAKQEIYCEPTSRNTDEKSPNIFITDGEYLDDDYNNSNLNLLSVEDRLDKKPIKCDSKILAKVTKIGWTYTPRKKSLTDTGEASRLLTPSKTALKEENYLLLFNDKEIGDRDEKDVCSMSSQTCAEGELLGKRMSGSSTKSKRSFTLGKIRSSLDFLMFFSKHKAKVTSCSSFEEVSKIKYRKMNSAKSTTF